MRQNSAIRLQKEQRFSRHGIAQFGCVIRIISTDANKLMVAQSPQVKNRVNLNSSKTALPPCGPTALWLKPALPKEIEQGRAGLMPLS